jgi:hypothetical protein
MNLIEKKRDVAAIDGACRTGPGTDGTAGRRASEIIQRSVKLIRELASLGPRDSHDLPIAQWPNKWEHRSVYPLAVAIVGFLYLGGAAGLHALQLLPAPWIVPSIWVGLGVYVFSIVSVAMNLIGSLASAFWLWRRQPDIRERRAERDLRVAEKLAQNESDVLGLADSWLEQDVKRIESRLALFFGGLDKVAGISLIGFAWLAWKEALGGSFAQFGSPIWFGLSLLAGIGLAGITLRVSLRELAYHRDLICLARKVKGTLSQ